jgi:membrane-associated phospholipid phosphatase
MNGLAARRLALLAALAAGPAAALAGQHATPPPLQWHAVAVAGGAIGVALLLDVPVARAVHPDAPSLAGAAGDLSRFGEIRVSAPVVGALAVAGLLAHRPRLTRTAARTAAGIAASATAVTILKFGVGRARPEQDPRLGGGAVRPFSGQTAMPSGHTAAAFAMATTLGDATDRLLPRLGLYALASGTAVGRVIGERHWVSDVVAGAAIGILAGKLADGRVSFLGIRAPRLIVGPGRVGVRLR